MKIFDRINSRTLVLLLVGALMMFVVAGCGDDDSGDKNANASGEGATSTLSAEEKQKLQEQAENGEGNISDEEAEKIENENFSEEPPPIQILTGSTTGYYVNKPTAIIANTKKELAAMKKKHFSHGVKKEDLPPIELGPRQIVGLFLPKDKEGALVSITDVHEENGKIVVKAVRLLPGKGCKSVGGAVRPFHWVETRTMKGDVKVEITTQKTSPC